MASRLLSELQVRIATTHDPVQNSCLRAERVTILARQGLLDQAREELNLIRARHAESPNAVVTAWVCLGEGMLIFFSDMSTRARDKILRAHALASACAEVRVSCLSAAWLAHLGYVEQDFASMVRNLEIAFTGSPTHDDLVRERASLVVAQALHWSGRFDLARPWYDVARRHATHVGDETFLSAFMYNMNWLHVAEERRRTLLVEGSRERASQLLIGAEATDSFDRRIGIASLGAMVPILRAHVLSLLDRPQEALVLFEEHLDDALSQGLSRIECSVRAELAWCQARSGLESEARSSTLAAIDRLKDCTEHDERAATHGRLAQCYRTLGENDAASRHFELFTVERDRNATLQQTVLELLSCSKSIPSATHLREVIGLSH